MPDVIDFLVLRQSYDEALRRNWQPSKFYHMLNHFKFTNLQKKKKFKNTENKTIVAISIKVHESRSS